MRLSLRGRNSVTIVIMVSVAVHPKKGIRKDRSKIKAKTKQANQTNQNYAKVYSEFCAI